MQLRPADPQHRGPVPEAGQARRGEAALRAVSNAESKFAAGGRRAKDFAGAELGLMTWNREAACGTSRSLGAQTASARARQQRQTYSFGLRRSSMTAYARDRKSVV